MFERFTERARQVVVLALDEARAGQSNYITTGHLLAGLLLEEHGLASRILGANEITIEDVRAALGNTRREAEVSTEQIPFSPFAKEVLDLALREALSLGHNYIGTEHILLGLIRLCQREGLTLFFGGPSMDLEALRLDVIRWLAGPPRETKEARMARYAEGFEQLRAWSMDEGHIVQSVRMHEPIYKNPGELRADVRRLLSLFDGEAALEASDPT